MATTHSNEAVDMVEIARQTTARDIARQFKGTVKLVAPAKVNLYLAVGDRQPNGYHMVQNVMHTVLMHDNVFMRMRRPAEAGGIVSAEDEEPVCPGLAMAVHCEGSPGVDAPQIPTAQNLAYKAVCKLAKILGTSLEDDPRVMEVRIRKGIPAQAGLAGGSSDAAAALVGAAKLLGIPSSDERLRQAARETGADVAFFLQGGCALYDGYGENLVRSFAVRKDNVVIMMPEAGLSTAKVYSRFDEMAQAGAQESSPAQDSAVAPSLAPAFPPDAQSAAEIPLFNSLEAPAFDLLPVLGQLKEWAARQPGVQQAMMTGSGSAVFAICESTGSACDLVAAAKQEGCWARATSFGPIRAAVIPER